MKYLISGIMGGVIVLLVVILFPTQIDVAQETIKQQSIHPCQRVIIDNFEIHKESANIRSFYGIGDERFDEKEKEWKIKLEQNQKISIENNCQNPPFEWITEEFMLEMKILWDEGF